MRPLLCSGPAVSSFLERRGFFVGQRFPTMWPGFSTISLASHSLSNRENKYTMQALGSWQIDGQLVRFQQEGFAAQLTLAKPYEGLHVSFESLPSFNVLGVSIDNRQPSEPTKPLDFYSRGDDLVVTYPESPDAVRTQIYWHWAPGATTDGAAGLPGFELRVSVQTHLLDSSPKIGVHSQLPASEVIECRGLDPGEYRAIPQTDSYPLAPPEEPCLQGLIFRLDDSDFSYAQLLHPSDVLTQSEASACQVPSQTLVEVESQHAANQPRCSSRLFFEPLEKGVIRRARVRGIFVPRENDLESVAACGQRFVEQKLPLTT